MSDTKPRRWEILEGATKTIVVGAYDYDSLEAKFSRLQVRYDCLSKVYVLTRESEAALEARIAELEAALASTKSQLQEATLQLKERGDRPTGFSGLRSDPTPPPPPAALLKLMKKGKP